MVAATLAPVPEAVVAVATLYRGMWRGGVRSDISVAALFVRRYLSGSAIVPFPHPLHRTWRANFPHHALGQNVTLSSTTRRAQAGSGVRARSTSSFSRIARRSLTLRPAHSHGHPIRDRYPKASDISSPPCLLRLRPAGAIAGPGLHPLEQRRLVTAHVDCGHSDAFGAEREVVGLDTSLPAQLPCFRW